MCYNYDDGYVMLINEKNMLVHSFIEIFGRLLCHHCYCVDQKKNSFINDNID